MLMQGIVTPIPATGLPATSSPVGLPLGRQGEALVSEISGKYYTQAQTGNVFGISTVVAGLAIPISTTTSPIMALWNPAGSGKNAVLLRYTYGYVSGTTVAGAIGFTYQVNAGNTVATGAVYTAFNAATPFNALLGGGNVSAMRSSAAATNTLTAASTNTFLYIGGESALISSTAMNGYTFVYDFEGSIIVPPGVTIYPVGTAASGALIAQSLWWIEVPV